jgi:hypothetical protein
VSYASLDYKRGRDAGYAAGLRRAIQILLGDKCFQHGCNVGFKLLHIHHTNGGGSQARVDVSGHNVTNPSYWRQILTDIREGKGGYVLACPLHHLDADNDLHGRLTEPEEA